MIPLMLLGAFLVPTMAHAQTGVVSVNSGAVVVGTTSPSTVSVPIMISGSQDFSGFDVQVYANTTYLQGASISLASSILPSPSILAECINGVLIAGTSCSSEAGFGVVQLSAANTVGTQTSTGTGLLFTINYNVVGNTPGTPISFNTGCTGTSIASGDCVTIASGGAAVPETDQGATFSNVVGFTMNSQYPMYSVPAGISANMTINYASEGGYQDFLTETYAVTPSGVSCTFASGSPGFVDLLDYAAQSDVVSCHGPAGSYTVTVTAMGQGIDSPPYPILTNTLSIPLRIASPGYSLSLSQSSVTIPRGNSNSTTTVNVQGFSGFSGTIAFSSSAASGITGTASSVALVPNGSGYSTASSALTISVASSVATGSYVLTETGTGGQSATITVNVPTQDFTIAAVPNVISIIRGGTLALDLNFASMGNLAGTVTLSAVIAPVAGQQDSCCLTNNITPAFSPASPTLTAGGSLTVFFFASTVGGTAPASSYTATGNYTAVVTAVVDGVTHSATISFNVEDFSVGPAYCVGTTTSVVSTPDSFTLGNGDGLFGLVSPYGSIATLPDGQNIAYQDLGTPCTSLTITNQPNILSPYFGLGNQVLFVQDNAYGGFQTNGYMGYPSVSAINQALPANGVSVPQLAPVLSGNPAYACLVPTYWANGTQIPYSYLAANGPIVIPTLGFYPFLSGLIGYLGVNWGCRYDNAAYPNDVGASAINAADGYAGNYTNVPGNPDFWGVTAMALNGTLAGDYTFQLCASNGVVQHCGSYGLDVVNAPTLYLTAPKNVSYKHNKGEIQFTAFFFNNDAKQTEYVEATATGIGTFGDVLTVTTPVVELKAGAFSINFSFPTAKITKAMIGETFTFTFVMNVGTSANNLDGTSTLHFGPSSFTVHITK
jgi:hypothetical protein